MGACIFLVGQTAVGDALGGSGRSLRPAFEEAGHEVVEINFAKPDAVSLLNTTLQRGAVELAFSHVGLGADFAGKNDRQETNNLWQGSGIPFISFYGDSPAYFFDRHVMPGSAFACLYAFPEHYRYRKRLPKCQGMIGVTPVTLFDDTPVSQIDPTKKRNGKLLFLKNGNDPKRLVESWRSALPIESFLMLSELASELAGKLTSDISCDIDKVVCDFFKNRDLDIDALVKLRLFFVAQLDDYLRRIKSTWMAEVLLNFPIQVHGFNWEHVDFSRGRATYIPGSDYAGSRHLIQDALGLLDMSPNTSERPHDRALRAFGLHTLCLTNEQAFFSRNFQNHRDFTFDFSRESLQGKVADVLARPGHYVDVGIGVADAARKAFDTRLLVPTMLKVASVLRLAAGPRPDGLQDFFGWPPTKFE